MSSRTRALSIALAFAAAAVLSPSRPSAQTSSAGPTCMTLLTADEVAKAVAPGFQNMGGEERSKGETECPWMLRGGSAGFKTVSVQFYTAAFIKEGTANNTLDAFFENIVSAGEDTSSKKREMLPGIGLKAAFVAVDPQVLGVVQLATGVARIVGNNLTKAQMTAVARAVAAP